VSAWRSRWSWWCSECGRVNWRWDSVCLTRKSDGCKGIRPARPVASPAPPTEPPRCPTPCDADCYARCHEVHAVPWKRDHRPQDCPSAGPVASPTPPPEPVDPPDLEDP
jgi:hypothetical protein